MKCVRILVVVTLVYLSCFITAAAPVKVGDAIPSLKVKDQFGDNYTFTNGTKFILAAVEMNRAKAANHKLSDQWTGFLEKHGAVYLMNIHPMPGVARLFALPEMKKYQHRIILIDTADGLGWVPVSPGCLTVLALTEDGRIRAVSHWNPETEDVTKVFE